MVEKHIEEIKTFVKEISRGMEKALKDTNPDMAELYGKVNKSFFPVLYKVEYNARESKYYVREMVASQCCIGEDDFNHERKDFPVVYISVDCYGNKLKEYMWLFETDNIIFDKFYVGEHIIFHQTRKMADFFCARKTRLIGKM